MRVCLTVDVEPDCPPYLETWRGIDSGMAWLLQALDDWRVPATCFVTGEVARRAPGVVRDLVSAGHELGSHGDRHLDYSRLSRDEARGDIEGASLCLRAFGSVTAFRAPYLRFPQAFLPLLEEAAFSVDSSQARYKGLGVGPHRAGRLSRIPASVTSSVLRLPGVVRDRVLTRLRDPIVLFVHPWEFVDLRHEPIRWDCRFRTGDQARRDLASTLATLERAGARFTRLRDCDVD